MAELDKGKPVLLEELMVSTLASTDALKQSVRRFRAVQHVRYCGSPASIFHLINPVSALQHQSPVGGALFNPSDADHC